MRVRHATNLFVLSVLLPARGTAAEIPVDSERWQVQAQEHRVEEHGGRPSLLLRGGLAWVAGSELLDGVLEFDVSFGQSRTFAGGIWRMVDERNYEEFYLRPHQSGNPDANQYTPVFHGSSAWQLYHGEGFSVPVSYRFDEWMHVRIAVSGGRAEVYLDDMERPLLSIPDLKREPAPGRVGLYAWSGAPVWFAGFRFEPGPVELRSGPAPPRATEAGTVTAWSVSSAFDGARLRPAERLDPALVESLSWTELASEPGGLANLARVQGPGEGQDTVLARVILESESEQMKRLTFGFSDRVTVYLDGRALFQGDDTYRSRDYRFLGTLGLHDAVFLPLRPGRNELIFAVGESFGGWGLMARLEDLSGVRLSP